MTEADSRYPDARPPTEAELDYLCTDCGCTMRAHDNDEADCGCGCAGAYFMPREYPEHLSTRVLSIDEALAYEGEWHGIEPCEDCGVNHTPVWWHVDFTEDSNLAALLRARADQVVARFAPEIATRSRQNAKPQVDCPHPDATPTRRGA